MRDGAYHEQDAKVEEDGCAQHHGAPCWEIVLLLVLVIGDMSLRNFEASSDECGSKRVHGDGFC